MFVGTEVPISDFRLPVGLVGKLSLQGFSIGLRNPDNMGIADEMSFIRYKPTTAMEREMKPPPWSKNKSYLKFCYGVKRFFRTTNEDHLFIFFKLFLSLEFLQHRNFN